MLTKDDLKAIVDVIGPLIKSEGELTRKEITTELKDYIRANNSVLGKIIRIELAEQKQEIVGVMKSGFQEVGKVIKELKTTQNKRFQRVEERVTKLEKQRLLVRN